MGIGESDPSPPRISEGKPGGERLEIELGERLRQESKLQDISEMSEEEFAKLTRNGGPKIVYFEGWQSRELQKKSGNLERCAPTGSVAFDLGMSLRGVTSEARYATAVQYYKPKNL